MADKSAPPELDPKLKEAYDRVMGTNLSKPAEQTTQPEPPATAPAPAGQSPLGGAPVESPKAAEAPVSHSLANVSKAAGSVQFYSNPDLSGKSTKSKKEEKPKEKKEGEKGEGGKNKIVLIIVLVIVFFLLYTIIWVKIFNLQLPFLQS